MITEIRDKFFYELCEIKKVLDENEYCFNVYPFEPMFDADEYYVILKTGIVFYVQTGGSIIPDFKKDDIAYIRKTYYSEDDTYEDTDIGKFTATLKELYSIEDKVMETYYTDSMMMIDSGVEGNEIDCRGLLI